MFKMVGRQGGKNNQNEKSPIQLGEGSSNLRQGFIQEGPSSFLDERSHSSPTCVMHFVLCTDVFANLCMQQVNWKVCLSLISSTLEPLSLAAREVAFFLLLSLILFFFSL